MWRFLIQNQLKNIDNTLDLCCLQKVCFLIICWILPILTHGTPIEAWAHYHPIIVVLRNSRVRFSSTYFLNRSKSVSFFWRHFCSRVGVSPLPFSPTQRRKSITRTVSSLSLKGHRNISSTVDWNFRQVSSGMLLFFQSIWGMS